MYIEIPQIKGERPDPSSASAILDTLDKHPINHVPWAGFSYKPEVSFALSYTRESILLKYYVREHAFKAVYNEANDPVYKDSCVEFFIAVDSDTAYYNFEFNAIGTCLAAYGEKGAREALSAEVIQDIKYQSVIKSKSSAEGLVDWELTLVIPFKVFMYHPELSLSGKLCRANFYKCGDDMPVPHFISWNDIKSDEPDFHLPGYFGEIRFN